MSVKGFYLVHYADVTIGEKRPIRVCFSADQLKPGHEVLEYAGASVPVEITENGLQLQIDIRNAKGKLENVSLPLDDQTLEKAKDAGMASMAFLPNSERSPLSFYDLDSMNRIHTVIEWRDGHPKVDTLEEILKVQEGDWEKLPAEVRGVTQA